MLQALDAITLEIIKNALASIADDMAIDILRSAYSPIVRDSMDYSSAICDSEGRLIAQGLTLPGHLGSYPDVMRNIVATYPNDTNPGDMFITNDPYSSGAMHLPDIYIVKPIFVDGVLEGYAATCVHHADVGGLAPGSMALHATEIFQEGLRIPLVKFYVGGESNSDILKLIQCNSRTPEALTGDLRSQVAACGTCETGFTSLIRLYGSQELRRYIVELQKYAEALMRAQITKMADGEYSYVEYLDGLGENPEPLKISVKLVIDGDDLTVDWTGSNGMVPGAINSTFASTRSVTYGVIRCVVGSDIPNAEGYMKPIKIIAPEGTIVNPTLPAACAARGLTCYRMYDALLGAFAQVDGVLTPAMGEGGPSGLSFSGWRGKDAWLVTDGILGAWGALPDKDGVDGIAHPMGNLSNQPIELIESRFPIIITNYGFVRNSGGAGRYRGGQALIREYDVVEDNATLTVRSDRRERLPAGFDGGLPGTPSLVYLKRKGEEEKLLPVVVMDTLPIGDGTHLRHVIAGGGGYGHPLQRDPARVLEDFLDDRVDANYAKEMYGVAIDESSGTVNEAATQALREKLSDRGVEEFKKIQLELFLEGNDRANLYKVATHSNE
jgi:N-methylhydantoinase B